MPTASLLAMLLAVIWMRRTKPKKVELRTVDDIANDRYDTMLLPLHFLLLSLGALGLAVRYWSVAETNLMADGHLGPGDPILIISLQGSFILVTMLLMRGLTQSLTAAQRVAVYRAAYMAGDWSFRLIRICGWGGWREGRKGFCRTPRLFFFLFFFFLQK